MLLLVGRELVLMVRYAFENSVPGCEFYGRFGLYSREARTARSKHVVNSIGVGKFIQYGNLNQVLVNLRWSIPVASAT